MEEAQGELLKRVCIEPLDTRLRKWRENTLQCFEQAWIHAANKGIHLGEEKAAAIYVHCLARAIVSEGISVPFEVLPKDEDIQMLLKGVLR
jgi:predicted trehalose synthase